MNRETTRAERRREQRSDASPPSPPARVFWLRSKLLPLLIVVAGLVAYHDSFQGVFVFDDREAIVNNPSIRELSWRALSPPWGRAVSSRPIVNLSLALNYAIGGLDVTSYHVFNVAVHILAALALFGIVRRTLLLPRLRDRFAESAAEIAAAVAVLWVVHPLLSESVSYVVQRTELMMGLFYLLLLYCVIRGAESPHPWPWYAGAMVSFLLGMGCKEIIATAPIVVLIYDRLFLSSSFAGLLRKRGALYGSLTALLLLAALYGSRMRWGLFVGPLAILYGRFRPWEYLQTQCGVIVHYLRLAVWPHPLAADYDDWPVAKSLIDVFPSAVLVVLLLGVTLWALYRRAPLSFLGVWFFVILSPTSSIFPMRTEVAAERRMYLSLAAVVTLLVLAAHAILQKLFSRPADASRRRLAAAALVSAVGVTFIGLTVRRNRDYQTALAYWTAAVATRPNAVRARINLGDVLYNAGNDNEATEQYAEAVRLGPDYLFAQYGLAVTLSGQGKTDEAIRHYQEALRIRPYFAAAHNNLATLLERQGKLEEAVKHYQAAVRFQPRLVPAHYNLALLLHGQGKSEEALEHLETVQKLKPELHELRAVIDEIRRTVKERSRSAVNPVP